jgi:site-specific recombinase XerD
MKNDFLNNLRTERCLAPSSIENYRRTLEKFETLLPNLLKGTRDEIRTTLVKLAEDGIDSRTIGKHISILREFYRFALRRGAIRSTPMNNIPRPKFRKTLPKPVQTVDFIKLLGAAIHSSSPTRLRDMAIVRVLNALRAARG